MASIYRFLRRPMPMRRTFLTLIAALVLAAPAAGAGSAKIAALQVGLRAHGVYDGSVDGLAGPATTAGVRKLQRRAGLTVDGVVGPATRKALGRYGRGMLGRRQLADGAIGWDVAALQFSLAWHGFPSGAARRPVRAPHRDGAAQVPGLGRTRRRRRARAGDAQRAPAARADGTRPARPPGRRRDHRRLRPARQQVPHRCRLPGAGRDARRGARRRNRHVRGVARGRLGLRRHDRDRLRRPDDARPPVPRGRRARATRRAGAKRSEPSARPGIRPAPTSTSRSASAGPPSIPLPRSLSLHQVAITRAGPPEPSSHGITPTNAVAPFAGICARFARFSIPNRFAPSSVRWAANTVALPGSRLSVSTPMPAISRSSTATRRRRR